MVGLQAKMWNHFSINMPRITFMLVLGLGLGLVLVLMFVVVHAFALINNQQNEAKLREGETDANHFHAEWNNWCGFSNDNYTIRFVTVSKVFAFYNDDLNVHHFNVKLNEFRSMNEISHFINSKQKPTKNHNYSYTLKCWIAF